MSKFDLGGTKHDQGKVRMDLLPPVALEQVAKVLTFGADKYDDHNWRKGFKYSRLIGAALRHIFSFSRGENLDPETGLPHLAHAACCILFLIDHTLLGYGVDDRYTAPKPEEALKGATEAFVASQFEKITTEPHNKFYCDSVNEHIFKNFKGPK